MLTTSRGGLFFVALAVVLAGCSSARDSVAPSPSVSADPDLFGAITGQVIDDELNPVRDAQVAVASSVVEPMLTDADGRFAFLALPPGPDTLYVAAIGYEAAARKIEPMAGQTQDITVRLSDVASEEPFSILETRQGLIACGSGAGFEGSGVTQVRCGAADENQRFLFNYTFGQDLKGILIEMRWTPAQAFSRDLVLNVEKDGCGVDCEEDDTFAQLQGCCYLRVPVTIDEMTKPAATEPATDFREDGGRIQTRTFPAFGETGNPVTVFTQQPFEIRVEYFYHELPVDWDVRSNMMD
ncbi:MAG TPA: carboxypeptidase-like regulatory domain-containing protein [Candidatus Thermoplasmatota archaeon]